MKTWIVLLLLLASSFALTIKLRGPGASEAPPSGAIAVEAEPGLSSNAFPPSPDDPGSAEGRIPLAVAPPLQTEAELVVQPGGTTAPPRFLTVKDAAGNLVQVRMRPVPQRRDDGLPEGAVLGEGTLVVHHPNGVVAEAGEWRDQKKQGLWGYWNEEGGRELEGIYVDGVAQGKWLAWHDSGVLRSECNVLDGKYHRTCVFYDHSGLIDTSRSGTYENGELVP